MKKLKIFGETLEFSIIFLFLTSFFVTFFLFDLSSYADVVSGKELFENSKKYDKKTVVYRGEIIGDVMKRGDFIWINLRDGDEVMGIFLPRELLPPIKYVGGYKTTGDILEVEGVFNAHCEEHGGDMDIHAEKIKIFKEGFYREEVIKRWKEVWTRRLFVLAAFWLSLILLRNFREKIKMKGRKNERGD